VYISDCHIYTRVFYFLKIYTSVPPCSLVPTALGGFNMEAASLSQIDTEWPADSLEFCPHVEVADIFVCGTYKLEESTEDQSETSGSAKGPQRRKGKCLVFRADEGNGTWCVIGRESHLDQALIGGKSTAPRHPNVRCTGHEMVYPHLLNRCEATPLNAT